MKKKLLSVLLASAMTAVLLAGCGKKAEESAPAPVEETEPAEEVSEEEEPEEEEVVEMSDEELAAECAALIDAIYVQQRTPETDQQCLDAKAAWDALTDAQKELVEGEEADPDYFGRDTGDASKDDPLNQDDIGENEILVVSFGTSFNDSRAADIGGPEKAIAAAFPDYSVRRAFTAQIIINHVQARDGEKIDNMQQALDRAVANGVKNLVIQPTHLMHGAEYDELMEAVEEYAAGFDTVRVAEPMLGQVGANGSEVNEDKKAVAQAVVEDALELAEYDSIDAAIEDKTAFVLMGHGTSHTAKVTYTQMQTQMQELGYDNVFIGTVEGEPEETACENVIEAVKDAGYTKVILRPLMVVAGDHANNDMAGEDEDSWLSMFLASDYFDEVDAQITGLGRIPAVCDLYVNHIQDALDEDPLFYGNLDKVGIDGEEIAPGEYDAIFKSDSSMFHINDALDDMGTLTVAKDGTMTMHLTLTSKNIVNLYPGTAEEAQKDAAGVLQPTNDSVTYDDGETDEVNGFDLPVPALGTEFDCALFGTKGKWYDHKVVVTLAN